MHFYGVIHVGGLQDNTDVYLLPSPREGEFLKMKLILFTLPLPSVSVVLRISTAIAVRRAGGNADLVNIWSRKILAVGQARNYSESLLVLLQVA